MSYDANVLGLGINKYYRKYFCFRIHTNVKITMFLTE